MKRKETKDQEVYFQLRRWILSGRLQPGERLIEQDLCDQLKLTRTPLRAALGRLCQDGLLVNEAYRGCILRQLSDAELAQSYDIREVLEGLAARLIVEQEDRATAENFIELALACDHAADDGDWSRYFKADENFHRELLLASKNPQLADIVNVKRFQIDMALKPLRLNLVALLPNHRRAGRHLPIAEALLGGDSIQAEVSVRDHIHQAKELCLRLLADAHAED